MGAERIGESCYVLGRGKFEDEAERLGEEPVVEGHMAGRRCDGMAEVGSGGRRLGGG